jgi:hypothetical protein
MAYNLGCMSKFNSRIQWIQGANVHQRVQHKIQIMGPRQDRILMHTLDVKFIPAIDIG